MKPLPMDVVQSMGAIILITFVALVGPLAIRYGIDSRIYEERPRSW
jgi:hypothetical protein